LTGDAGSGKSTIACTVARHFDDKTKGEDQNILRANFFCSRQFEETRRQKNIIPTIVYQLARQSRSYVHALLGANKFDSVDVLSEQMKDLLVGPWQQSTSDRPPELPPYLVVIDALDEIEGQGGSAFLRELLTTVDGGQFQGLKFLITSRPDPELASLCSTLSSDAVCCLYDVPMESVEADILVHLKEKLPLLQNEPQLTHLAWKADGLFIYAATVVRYITPRPRMSKHEQLKLMHKLLDHTWPMSTSAHMSPSMIDKLYQQILWAAF
jgi:NACHT domain